MGQDQRYANGQSGRTATEFEFGLAPRPGRNWALVRSHFFGLTDRFRPHPCRWNFSITDIVAAAAAAVGGG